MSAFRTYTIGRRGGAEIPFSEPSVSRRHAELVVAGDLLYLTDCASTYGTFVDRGQGWEAVKQEFLQLGWRIRFGESRTSVIALAAQAEKLGGKAPIREAVKIVNPNGEGGAAIVGAGAGRAEPPDDRPIGPVRRNPRTGELEGI